ncbi:hypothetical protein ACJ72_06280, partial [Emergomyces africanus]
MQQPLAHDSNDRNIKEPSNGGGESTGKTKRKRKHKSHKPDTAVEAGMPQLGESLAVE